MQNPDLRKCHKCKRGTVSWRGKAAGRRRAKESDSR
jgi:hypothetical protein